MQAWDDASNDIYLIVGKVWKMLARLDVIKW